MAHPRLALLLAACLLASAGAARAECVVDDQFTDSSSGCETCSKDGSKCEQCWSNYVLVDGSCTKCTVPEDAGSVHCVTCSASNTSYCEECQSYCNTGGCRGYWAVDGACVTCPSAGCSECDGEGKCQFCRNGYGLVDGECRQCLIENCRSCDGDLSKCTGCITPKPVTSQGYFVDPVTGNCTQCPKPCHTCSEDGKSCTECPYSSVDPATGNCTTCAVANCLDCYDDVKTCNGCQPSYGLVDGACQACKVANCQMCDDDTGKCTSCLDGFGISEDGTTCFPCAKGCLYCDEGADTCTACMDDNLFWDPKSKTCTNCTVPNCSYCDGSDASVCSACADGYMNAEDGSGGCEACKVKDCIYCSDSLDTCDEDGCAEGFYYDSAANACSPCAEGCAICNSAGSCGRCADGYWMDDSKWACNKCAAGDAAKHGACPK